MKREDMCCGNCEYHIIIEDLLVCFNPESMHYDETVDNTFVCQHWYNQDY